MRFHCDNPRCGDYRFTETNGAPLCPSCGQPMISSQPEIDLPRMAVYALGGVTLASWISPQSNVALLVGLLFGVIVALTADGE